MGNDYCQGDTKKTFRQFCQLVIAALVLAIINTGTVTAQTGVSKEPEGPRAAVEKLNSRLLEAMKGGTEIGYNGRHAILEPIIQEVFAFDLIVRISSGRYWQAMTKRQRHRLTELYRQWATAVYAQQYDSFNGQHFEVIEPERPWGDRVSVASRMIKDNGDEISFLYKLVKKEGQWKIVDIHVKGVSQLATTRAQFTSILKQDGFDGLAKVLQEKRSVKILEPLNP